MAEGAEEQLLELLNGIVEDYYKEFDIMPNEIHIDEAFYHRLTKVFVMSLVRTAPLTLKIKGRVDVVFIVDSDINTPVAGYNKDLDAGYDFKIKRKYF